MKKRRKTKAKKASARKSRKQKAHASLREFHQWLARGEKLFAPLVAGGEEISKGMRKRVHQGLARLKGRTDRMLESWEKEIAAHLESKDR